MESDAETIDRVTTGGPPSEMTADRTERETTALAEVGHPGWMLGEIASATVSATFIGDKGWLQKIINRYRAYHNPQMTFGFARRWLLFLGTE